MFPLRMASSLHHIEQSIYSLFFLIVVTCPQWPMEAPKLTTSQQQFLKVNCEQTDFVPYCFIDLVLLAHNRLFLFKQFDCPPPAPHWTLCAITPLPPVNPLSPDIHLQILHTDLYTLPIRISWENLKKDHGIFTLVIILLIISHNLFFW